MIVHQTPFKMILKCNILIGFCILACSVCGQSNSRHFAFIDSALNKESYSVSFIDFEFPEELQAILLKFQRSMAEKKEWAEEYISKNMKEGEALPYHEYFGISKEEYQKIRDNAGTNTRAVIKDSSSFTLERKGKKIFFTAGDEKTEFMESLLIDLQQEMIFFITDTLPFANEINAPASTPLGEWHGYSWKKEVSNLKDDEDLKLDKLVARILEISFGVVKSNQKLMLRVKYKDVDKGDVKANFEVICYLQ